MSALHEPDGEEREPLICVGCNGSGEGHYDGTRCSDCGGSGVEELRDSDGDFYEPDEPEECHRYYDGT